MAPLVSAAVATVSLAMRVSPVRPRAAVAAPGRRIVTAPVKTVRAIRGALEPPRVMTATPTRRTRLITTDTAIPTATSRLAKLRRVEDANVKDGRRIFSARLSQATAEHPVQTNGQDEENDCGRDVRIVKHLR